MSRQVASFVIALVHITNSSSAQESSALRPARGLLSTGTRELLSFDRDGAMVWYRNESPGAPLRRLASLDCGFRRRFHLDERGGGHGLALGLDLADRAHFLQIRAVETGARTRLLVEECWTGPRSVRTCSYRPGSQEIVFLDPDLRELRAQRLEERPVLGHVFAEGQRLFGAEFAPALRDPRRPALLRLVPSELGLGLRRSSSFADYPSLYVEEAGRWAMRPWITETPSGASAGTGTKRFAWVIRQAPGRRDTRALKVRAADGAYVIEDVASGEILGNGRASASQWVTVALRRGLPPGTVCSTRGPAGIASRSVELPVSLVQPRAETELTWSGIDVRRQASRGSDRARYLLRCDLCIAPQSARLGQQRRVLALASIAPGTAALRPMETSDATTVPIPERSELRPLPAAEVARGRVLHFLSLPTGRWQASSVAGFPLLLVDRKLEIVASSDIAVLRSAERGVALAVPRRRGAGSRRG